MIKKIMFGVCTYNRIDITRLSAKSMSRILNISSAEVCVFDDNSSDYSIAQLKEIYPFATCIIESAKNSGADANSLKMLQYFNASEAEWLFIADSDLIYCENIIDIISKCIEEYYSFSYKGVISLFNTDTHPMISRINDFLGKKNEVGAAGVLMNKEISRLIVETRDESKHYDVYFSKVLREKGFDILCTNDSYVQHIGIEGYNSLFYNFDWGKNFVIDSYDNAKAIIHIFDILFKKIYESNKRSVESRIEEDVTCGRIGIKVLIKMLLKSGIIKIKKIIK